MTKQKQIKLRSLNTTTNDQKKEIRRNVRRKTNPVKSNSHNIHQRKRTRYKPKQKQVGTLRMILTLVFFSFLGITIGSALQSLIENYFYKSTPSIYQPGTTSYQKSTFSF